VADPAEREAIAALTRGYPEPADYYVDLLAQGMARIAAAFHPRPVILRFSDFKSNEYARLLGGAAFEPKEENPMLGWRGASRYCSPAFRDAFALECQALRRVREDMGLTNAIPMVPFCRTPEEGDRVLAEMERHGLRRGQRVQFIAARSQMHLNGAVRNAQNIAHILLRFARCNPLQNLNLAVGQLRRAQSAGQRMAAHRPVVQMNRNRLQFGQKG
jgi:hypothetical protein